ncbi:MAG TPA: hypothetical protein VHF22_13700, partial [Planctomycetota bacterium]|nr:hypothetical protein [Planctomycetota bacterium]
MSASVPSEATFDLRASVDGREILFERLELWWSEAEPPEHDYPTFTLITSADAPADAPRVEVECPAPEATTFRDLSGEEFRLAPLATDGGGGWVLIDLGRDWKSRGFPAREWVAKEARVKFEEKVEDILEGVFEAQLERSAAKGGG